MHMIKVLFFLPTLGNGGAEKVLVNLVNNMDTQMFDITVKTLFDEGENRERLASHIHYISCMKKARKGLVQLMKCASPKLLHRLFIKEAYDLEIAYLEGIATRIISGCQNSKTKKIAWVHTELASESFAAHVYRNFRETVECYEKFDIVACVSEQVRHRFCTLLDITSEKTVVQYNTNESDLIRSLAQESVTDCVFSENEFKIIAVGKITHNKGFDRLARVLKKLLADGLHPHIYIMGVGEDKEKIEKYLTTEGISHAFTFVGYRKNPYCYVSRCDLFVCSSYREGFSTAATEALIVGTPVLTVDVSGMRELLGEHNDYGIIVPNDDVSLYQGLKDYMVSPELHEKYRKLAEERGKRFNRDVTVSETENLLMGVAQKKEGEEC